MRLGPIVFPFHNAGSAAGFLIATAAGILLLRALPMPAQLKRFVP